MKSGLVRGATDRFNGWLASEWGLLQSVAITLLWTFAALYGLDDHGFWFLYLATAFSFITQFNIAIIGKRSSDKLDQALDELYATAQTLLQIASNEATRQEGEAAQLDALSLIVEEVRALISDSPHRWPDSPRTTAGGSATGSGDDERTDGEEEDR